MAHEGSGNERLKELDKRRLRYLVPMITADDVLICNKAEAVTSSMATTYGLNYTQERVELGFDLSKSFLQHLKAEADYGNITAYEAATVMATLLNMFSNVLPDYNSQTLIVGVLADK